MIRTLRNYDDDADAEIGPSPSNVRLGVPSSDWSREELANRATAENKEIKSRENDASHYWFLGKALKPILADFGDHL